MQSLLREVAQISFPKHVEHNRVYQVAFHKDAIPEVLKPWENTIQGMLKGIDCDGEMYFMADKAAVQKGKTHRRGGLHIDGNWYRSVGHDDGNYCAGRHGGGHGAMQAGWGDGGGRWNDVWKFTDDATGGIILASDIAGCDALVGKYDGTILKGGDCSHIDTTGMKQVSLKENTAYIGNVTMLHESLPMQFDCVRTVCRITMPANYRYLQ